MTFDQLAGITESRDNGSRFDQLAGLTESEQLDEMFLGGGRNVSDEERDATFNALERRMEDEVKLVRMRYDAALKGVREARAAMKGAKSSEGQDYHAKASKGLATAAAALGSCMRCCRGLQDQIYDAMPMVRG